MKEEICAKHQVRTIIKHFVSLPSEGAHSGHPIGRSSKAIFSQKLHPKVTAKITEMVQSGITETAEVKRSLKYYVDRILSDQLGHKPATHDRAFYPLNSDIRNHICMAKKALDLSKFDQKNLELKIDEWKKTQPDSQYYFRPYQEAEKSAVDLLDNCSSADVSVNTKECLQLEKPILYVHQDPWQQDLILRYGNLLTLMDATYKTTKYSVPLFFLCVKTNVSYTVVGEFIIQSEDSDNIFEALSVISSWNPDWKPQFFLTDYSEAEMAAVAKLFPSTQLYLCDFHREQAWERWVKERSHELTNNDAEILLDLLRNCANASPNRNTSEGPVDHYFQLELKHLKESNVWLRNEQVCHWLTSTWLCCSEVIKLNL